MQPHLKLLGILQLLWGWIGLLLGVSTLMLAAGAAAIGLTSSANGLSAGATAATFAIFSAVLLVGGLANAWAGAAIRKLQPEGRLATLGLAVPNLFLLPFGTALGVYAFWVLLHDETRKMFGIRS